MTVPEPLDPLPLGEPDQAWLEIRDDATTELRDGPWTDHNISDPGITMLEAAALSIADLHYRTATTEFTDAHVMTRRWEPGARHWTGTDIPSGTAAHVDIATVLADHLDEIDDLIDGATDRHEAISVLADSPTFELGWDEASAIVRLLRAPVVRRGALDLAGAVDAAIEVLPDDEAAAIDLLRHDPSFAPLWDSEIKELFVLRNRRHVEQHLVALAATVQASTSLADLATELTSLHGLSAEELVGALAYDPLPTELEPESFEAPGGATLVWPPHPIQTRSTEPVTEADYARLARRVDGVRRAWVRPGRLAGIGWDGRPAVAGTEPGALTIIVEPTDDAAPGLAMRVLRGLARDGELAEVDDPYDLYREEPHWSSPRRVICDEIGVAELATCPVVVKAALQVAVGTVTNRADVIAAATERVAAFFKAGRAESQPIVGELDPYEGPWPVGEQPPSGWIPGEPIRLFELIDVLADDDAVLGVSDVSLRRPGGDWYPGAAPVPPLELAIDPDCVPVLADAQCVTVAYVLEGP